MAKRHRHNQGGGNQPREKRFDESRDKLFEYDARQVLEDAPIDEDHYEAFLQQIKTRGSRQGIDEAKSFLREKVGEGGPLTEEAARELEDLLDKYSKYR
jgi:hypothetical protein